MNFLKLASNNARKAEETRAWSKEREAEPAHQQIHLSYLAKSHPEKARTTKMQHQLKNENPILKINEKILKQSLRAIGRLCSVYIPELKTVGEAFLSQ